MMRYTILTKGDSKSNALKHKMINHMGFSNGRDSENPEIVYLLVGTARYSSIQSI